MARRGSLLVTGERRWRAAKIAGLKSIPAVVVDPLASDQKLVRQIIEKSSAKTLTTLTELRHWMP